MSILCVCVCSQSLQSCPTQYDTMDSSPPGYSVLEILQARILEWVTIPFSGGSSRLRDSAPVSCIAGRFLPSEPPGKVELLCTQFSSVSQLCLILCRPMDCSMPASPPCPSPTPGVYSNSCPLSQSCHPNILSSIIPFSSSLQFFPALGSFPMSWFFPLGGQSVGVSASTSVLPMNIQD